MATNEFRTEVEIFEQEFTKYDLEINDLDIFVPLSKLNMYLKDNYDLEIKSVERISHTELSDIIKGNSMLLQHGTDDFEVDTIEVYARCNRVMADVTIPNEIYDEIFSEGNDAVLSNTTPTKETKESLDDHTRTTLLKDLFLSTKHIGLTDFIEKITNCKESFKL